MKSWFPFPALAIWHKTTALKSAKKICDLQPSVLAVGHDAMLKNLLGAMTKAINECERLT